MNGQSTQEERIMHNDFLQQVIIDFVRGFGVTIMLRQEIKTNLVKQFVCDWVGADDSFYSLAVFYNETSLLPIGCNQLVSSLNNEEILNRNLRKFKSKADWCRGCWSDKELMKLNDDLIARMLAIENMRVQCGDYKILSAKMYVNPSFGISLWYESFGKIECLTTWYGTQTTVNAAGHGLTELVKKLGLSGCVRVIEKSNCYRRLQIDE